MHTSTLAGAAARFRHQLRNELALARAALQLSSRYCRDDAALRYVQRALAAVDSASRLVDMAEAPVYLAGGSDMRRLDLVAFCRQLLDRLNPRFEQAGVSTAWAGSCGRRVPVLADEGLLTLAVTNLLVNAMEATPAGGHVEVAVREAGIGGCWAELTVQDSGPGFAPELLHRVLRERITTKGPANSGWGLLIVREIVEDIHGGRVEVGNEPQGGARCSIRLPVVTGPEGED